MHVVGRSVALVGLCPQLLQVEAQLTRGLPGVELVGVPDRVAREIVIRVRAALVSTGIDPPPKHIVVNVAPGELRKSGAGLDLPVALVWLGAIGLLPPSLFEPAIAIAELGLDGALRPVAGALAMLEGMPSLPDTPGMPTAAWVAEAQLDAAHARRVPVHGAPTLRALLGALHTQGAPPRLPRPTPGAPRPLPELAEVAGHEAGKRALLVAATGRHAVLLTGPPGAGKTMLARRLPGLLPPPSDDEVLGFATVRSAAGLDATPTCERPFRAPHHSASAASIVGGGDPIRPGEVTLAHGGVLFLDELPEFRRDTLESLRTLLETGEVTLTRVHGRVMMPARPLLVAARNPCPCGFAGDPTRLCTCPPDRVARYAGRVSGPLLDRFDLLVDVPRMPSHRLADADPGPTTEAWRTRVVEARALLDTVPDDSPRALARALEPKARVLLERAADRLSLSARGHVKVMRVARTLAALRNSTAPSTEDVAEALTYRGRPAVGSSNESVGI